MVFANSDNYKTINDVIAACKLYISDQKSIDLIQESYDLAYQQHEGQFRKSGDPYIQHPIEVAYMLACLKVSPVTIIAGFLHDVLEDTEISKEEIF